MNSLLGLGLGVGVVETARCLPVVVGYWQDYEVAVVDAPAQDPVPLIDVGQEFHLLEFGLRPCVDVLPDLGRVLALDGGNAQEIGLDGDS